MDFEKFQKELKRIKPTAEGVEVGSFKGFKYVQETGLFRFTYVDLFVPELGFLHLVARNSYDEELMISSVEQFEKVRIKKYKKDILHVYKASNLKQFDTLGIAPPELAMVYKSESKILSEKGYHIFAMFGLEFLDKFTSDQFWTARLRRDKWAVCILNWNRTVSVGELN